MSVETMKLLTVAGPLSRFDEVAAACVVDREIHLEPTLRLMRNTRGLRPLTGDDPYAAPLRRAEDLCARLSVPLERREGGDWTLESAAGYFDDLEGRLGALTDRRETLEREADQCRHIAGQLEHLHGLSASLDDLWGMTYARFRYGYLPRETYNGFADALSQREDLFFLPTSVEGDRVYGVYFTTKGSHRQVDTLLNSLHFVRVRIEASPAGTVEEAVADLEARAAAVEERLRDLDRETGALRAAEGERLLGAYTWLRYRRECREVRRFAACSRDTFYLTGWVPETAAPALVERLQAEEDVSCVLDDGADPQVATPPTKLKSGPLSRIFRPFLELYGLPAYNETDPSAFMAVTYCLFFGIMFGDVGQGLGLAAIGAALWKWKGQWLGKIIACCGLSGAAFGCVYGSVFGFEDWLPGFKVLEGNHVMVLLLLSVALGVVLLLAAMGINIANGVRQKNYEKILFGPNGAAGAVFYCGLLVLAVTKAAGLADLAVPAYLLPVLVLPLALMLLREPLAGLLARDPGWRKVRLGELLGLGCFELFETLLSYLTNTLSFLRVGAYAVIHVGMMLVVHMMAGSGNLAVLVLGNLFVMGFEGFLVGIQVLRLEFYELFSRFYDDGGIPYRPHIIDYTVRSTR